MKHRFRPTIDTTEVLEDRFLLSGGGTTGITVPFDPPATLYPILLYRPTLNWDAATNQVIFSISTNGIRNPGNQGILHITINVSQQGIPGVLKTLDDNVVVSASSPTNITGTITMNVPPDIYDLTMQVSDLSRPGSSTLSSTIIFRVQPNGGAQNGVLVLNTNVNGQPVS